ncbi:hypothetical protein EON66_08815, partial [archaeon]
MAGAAAGGLAATNVIASGLALRSAMEAAGKSAGAEGDSHETGAAGGGSSSGAGLALPPGRSSYTVCYRCKKVGHTAVLCPLSASIVACYICGQQGHISSRCALRTVCFVCDEVGHVGSACPNARAVLASAAASPTGVPLGYGRRVHMELGPAGAVRDEWWLRPDHRAMNSYMAGGAHFPRQHKVSDLLTHHCPLCAAEQWQPHHVAARKSASSVPGSSSAADSVKCPHQHDTQRVTCFVCGARGHAYCNAHVVRTPVEVSDSAVAPAALPSDVVLSPMACQLLDAAAVGKASISKHDVKSMVRGLGKPFSLSGNCCNCGSAEHQAPFCSSRKYLTLRVFLPWRGHEWERRASGLPRAAPFDVALAEATPCQSALPEGDGDDASTFTPAVPTSVQFDRVQALRQAAQSSKNVPRDEDERLFKPAVVTLRPPAAPTSAIAHAPAASPAPRSVKMEAVMQALQPVASQFVPWNVNEVDLLELRLRRSEGSSHFRPELEPKSISMWGRDAERDSEMDADVHPGVR